MQDLSFARTRKSKDDKNRVEQRNRVARNDSTVIAALLAIDYRLSIPLIPDPHTSF